MKEKLPSSLVDPLTPRELAILRHLDKGLSNAEVAELETLALSSVKWYVQQICQKLGVDNRQRAATRARELGLLGPAVPPVAPPSYELPTGLVTFLFTDIQDSTPLWEQMPDAMEIAVAQHHRLLRQAIETSGGHIYQIIGDSFQAAFRLASAGLDAALAAQRALLAASWGATGPIRVRMGLHTGPAERDLSGNAPYAVSHTLNRATRVMDAGHGGQVLLSEDIANLIKRDLPEGVTLKDLGEQHLKGLHRLERLYQVIAPGLPFTFPPLRIAEHARDNLPHPQTPLIGRAQEVAAICERLLRAEVRILTLTGTGGTGREGNMDIIWLGSRTCNHCPVVGGKGAGLCHLSGGFLIPPLFSVTAEAYTEWANQVAPGEERLPGPLFARLEQAYTELAARTAEAEPAVAVRSSALDEDGQAVSFAGQHQTFLNIRGIDALSQAVIQCWASAHHPSALAYRRQHELDLNPQMAVLVQQLIPADVSAVIFTANPVTGERGKLLINAAWGLGESLVSGAVTPDEFVVQKDNLSVVARQVADKQTMTVMASVGVKNIPVPRLLRRQPSLGIDQLSKIGHLGLRLEEIMGQPVDIECAYRGESLYLLQCRPITTLKR